MSFSGTDIKRGILELSTYNQDTYCAKYAQLFYKTLTQADESVILQFGTELLSFRPKELRYSQKTKMWSKWDLSTSSQPFYSDIERFYAVLKDKVFSKVDFSQCCGIDISGLNLEQNKTVTRELIERAPDLTGVIFPAMDLTGCDLKDKRLSGSDLSRVTGLKPENLFPDYSDKTWSQNYTAKSYNGVKFPEMDMTGVSTKYLLFKNCKGLRNGPMNSMVTIDFEEYLQSQKVWWPLNFTYRAFSRPFLVPKERVCRFTACDLTNVTFAEGAQLALVNKCRISLDTYRTFFKGNSGMRKLMTENKISCPELDSMVTDLLKSIHEIRPELSIDKNRIWKGEREERWDIIKLHDILQTNLEQFKQLITQLFILSI